MRAALLCAIVFICVMVTCAYAGKVELTTYYPAPRGDYENLTTTSGTNLATTNGNVGIGTATPQATLEVIGPFTTGTGVKAGVQITNTADGGTVGAIYANYTTPGPNLILNPSGGRVGINIANPSQMLEVNGNIAGKNTTNGWVLGKGAPHWVADTWLRLTQTNNPLLYHDFMCGQLYANGLLRFDLAEMTPVKEEDALELGDAVVVDGEKGLRVIRSSKPYDTAVYGIVSSMEQAAMVIGGGVDPKSKDRLPVALIGRIKAKVSAENGAIAIGDLLTTSATPGHLMKCEDKAKCFGAVAGKALEPFESGQGTITVLATLQ